MNPLEWHARWTRREALAVLGGMAGLAACRGGDDRSAATSSAAEPTTAPTMTTAPPATTVAAGTSTTAVPAPTFALDRSLWSQGNYAAVSEEIEAFDLPVRGALPPELDGLYVRNGSNPQDPSSQAHWFVGDGMLHGVRLGGGSAEWYRNRWVATSVLGNSAGTIPGGAANTSNTSIKPIGGRLLSMEEVGFPYEISPSDLSTIGAFDFAGGLTTSMTAHPRTDPVTGLVHFFGYGFVPPYLTYYVADASGRIVHAAPLDLPAPVMIHDFAITEHFAVFWDLPVVFSMDAAIAGSSMPFVWQPGNGARVGVLPHGGTAADLRWVEIEPCFVFHSTNAWEEDGAVVLDVSRLPSAFAAPDERTVTENRLERWRLTPSGETYAFSAETVVERFFDLPTVPAGELGRPHAKGFYVNARNATNGYEFGGIASVERVSGVVDEWDPGWGFAAGEPLVVGDHVLTFVYDRAGDTSTLAVFEADAIAAGPVAEVELPRRVPFGFHGCWLPGGLA